MRAYCCLDICDRTSINSPGISFFTFPSDPAKQQAWLAVILQNTKQAVEVRKWTRICEMHFESRALRKVDKVKRIVRDKLPSVFEKKDKNLLVSIDISVKSDASSGSMEAEKNSSQPLPHWRNLPGVCTPVKKLHLGKGTPTNVVQTMRTASTSEVEAELKVIPIWSSESKPVGAEKIKRILELSRAPYSQNKCMPLIASDQTATAEDSNVSVFSGVIPSFGAEAEKRVPKCNVVGCKSTSPSFALFSIPTSNYEMWEMAICDFCNVKSLEEVTLSKNSRLCELHFSQTSFLSNWKEKKPYILRGDVIPVFFDPDEVRTSALMGLSGLPGRKYEIKNGDGENGVVEIVPVDPPEDRESVPSFSAIATANCTVTTEHAYYRRTYEVIYTDRHGEQSNTYSEQERKDESNNECRKDSVGSRSLLDNSVDDHAKISEDDMGKLRPMKKNGNKRVCSYSSIPPIAMGLLKEHGYSQLSNEVPVLDSVDLDYDDAQCQRKRKRQQKNTPNKKKKVDRDGTTSQESHIDKSLSKDNRRISKMKEHVSDVSQFNGPKDNCPESFLPIDSLLSSMTYKFCLIDLAKIKELFPVTCNCSAGVDFGTDVGRVVVNAKCSRSKRKSCYSRSWTVLPREIQMC